MPGDYSYDCSAGHYVQAAHPLEVCPACIDGEPCPGSLRRVGRGSRAKVAA